MAKSENIFVRVEPQVKEQAEAVLDQLGIPMSNAVGMFLHQVVLQKGIPFEIKIPNSKPLVLNSLSDEEFNTIMENGMKDYADNRVHTSQEVRMQMKRNFNV